MDERAKAIVKTLGLCLFCGLAMAAAKIAYGRSANSLAFVADGVHVLFDAGATIMGMITILWSSKPPDEDHPYGHHKFETVCAIILGILLLFAAYEVGSIAYTRLFNPDRFPTASFLGVAILVATMVVSLGLARLEEKMAARHASSYLAADSLHNRSDFWITLAVLGSVLSVHFRIPYVDAGVSILIALYLVYLAVHLMLENLKPLVDASVLDPRQVESIVSATEGVLHCHHIRSRGEAGRHFLDLNIHLPGHITLERAHEITHDVEQRLKAAFPGLVDVVIHTEPHGHPPCAVD